MELDGVPVPGVPALVNVASYVPAGLVLIRAILNTSPETVTAAAEIAPVVAALKVNAVDDVVARTLEPAATFVPVTDMPTAMPVIDDTDVTLVAADAAVTVGVMVAPKQCPAHNSSCLNEVGSAVVAIR